MRFLSFSIGVLTAPFALTRNPEGERAGSICAPGAVFFWG